MARTSEQYRDLLLSLLPKGKIWPDDPNSTLAKYLYGMAEEYYRIESRGEDLYEEKDVTTAEELLDEHEIDFGLPDAGDVIADNTAKRRQELQSVLLRVGQQFSQYFIDIASALGYDITIEEFMPFWAGVGQSGDSVGVQNNIFIWRVLIDITSVTYYSEVNLTKLINKIKKSQPAHTLVLFEFTGPAFSRGFTKGFDSIPHYDNSWPTLGFSRGFSNAFANAYDYDGVNYTGGFRNCFNIGFNRYSGGGFTDGFALGFSRQH